MKLTRSQLRKLILEQISNVTFKDAEESEVIPEPQYSTQPYPGKMKFPGHSAADAEIRRAIDYDQPEYKATPLERQRIKNKASDNYVKNLQQGMERRQAERLYDAQSKGYPDYLTMERDLGRKEAYAFHGYDDMELAQKTREELAAEFPDMDFTDVQPDVDLKLGSMLNKFMDESPGGKTTVDKLENFIRELVATDKSKQDKEVGEFIAANDPEFLKYYQEKGYYKDIKLNENKFTRKDLRNLMNEELARLSYASKEQGFTYGLEHLPDQYDQKKADDIIGHTWLTHVRKKGSSLNEVGYVLWHSLNESGHIAVYDVEWPDGRVERDIPARLLEKVKDSENINEKHNEHNHIGHEEDSLLSERKYKKSRVI